MRTVRYTTTLDYYDGPLLFEAQDRIGGHYLAMAVPSTHPQDKFVVVGVAPERLRQFRVGLIDLREVVEEAGKEEWFFAATSNLDDPLELKPQDVPLASTGLLPDEGFFLHDSPAGAYVLEEAQARNNLVFELKLEPPEAALGHRIRVETYVELLDKVQKMVAHAYRVALRQLPSSYRPPLPPTEAVMMDVVVPAAPGSFRVVLEAAGKPDLFGGSELARALKRVDVLFEHTGNPDAAIETVKQHQGHLASAYLKLLQLLTRRRTGLSYSWAQPTLEQLRSRTVTAPEAKFLAETLASVSDLGTEEVALVGEFVKVNRNTGAWGISTEEGLQSGKSNPESPSLNGLTVGSRYKFYCIEQIEYVEATGKEIRSLYLREFANA